MNWHLCYFLSVSSPKWGWASFDITQGEKSSPKDPSVSPSPPLGKTPASAGRTAAKCVSGLKASSCHSSTFHQWRRRQEGATEQMTRPVRDEHNHVSKCAMLSYSSLLVLQNEFCKCTHILFHSCNEVICIKSDSTVLSTSADETVKTGLSVPSRTSFVFREATRWEHKWEVVDCKCCYLLVELDHQNLRSPMSYLL